MIPPGWTRWGIANPRALGAMRESFELIRRLWAGVGLPVLQPVGTADAEVFRVLEVGREFAPDVLPALRRLAAAA